MTTVIQAGLALLTLLGMSLTVAAEPTQEITLNVIMQGLRDDVFVIADGMFTDNMELVVQGADGIADHPSIPSGQVRLVAAELGSEMPAFKSFDQQVHDLSVSISSAAKLGDRERISQDFQKLINGCLACHAPYKERVADILKEPNQ